MRSKKMIPGRIPEPQMAARAYRSFSGIASARRDGEFEELRSSRVSSLKTLNISHRSSPSR